MFWKTLGRPILFRLDAERTHYLAMNSFHSMCCIPGISSLFRAVYQVQDPRLRVRCAGIEFPNPVGLGAGFDKQARWFNDLSCLGFGSIEVGTITQHAQPGNDKPRLFRLPADQALVNRMGFNNAGSEEVARQLSRRKIRPVLGINLGKSKVTPLEQATDDYLTSLDRLFDSAAYFTINVSSPNTPGLRDLQALKPLMELLAAVVKRRDELGQERGGARRPVFVKIAPDLDDAAFADIVQIIQSSKIDGVIATNTTNSRADLNTDAKQVESIGAGGVSGKPLTERSRAMVARLYQELSPHKIPIIGVGGIMSEQDAWAMIQAGASMIQIYTGFIYEGPGFITRILKHFQKQLDQRQLSSIHEVVGEKADEFVRS